jgi:meso-butanediol dehydrogenase / (S,S)-butanediol dehydrogenase / diacetyl reductase
VADSPSSGVSRGPVAGRLAGKVVLMSGTGAGMGQTTALLFAQAGATVVGAGRRVDKLDETRRLVEAEGLTIDQSVVDMTDPEESRAWVDAAAAKYGGIDVLYNNAGFVHFAPVPDMTPFQWHETLRGEMDIAFFPIQAAWPHLVKRGGGSIVNIASLAGMRAVEDTGAIAHAAAKGGLIAMASQLALEGAPHWIRCNTISPGPVMSPGTEAFLRGGEHLSKRLFGWPLLSRVGYAADIAYAGLFLASDEARWITGVNIPVDGGWSAKGGMTDHEHIVRHALDPHDQMQP